MSTSITPRRRLGKAFAAARAERRPALIGYLPAGFPSLTQFLAAARGLAEHVDILEIGLPHGVSHELEGPAIQRACQIAIESGPHPSAAFQAIRELAASTDTPVVAVSSWELVTRRGADRWMAASLAGAGAAGLVLPDIHPSGAAATRWLTASDDYDLSTTFLATTEQWQEAAAASTDWIYLPATFEKTGTTSRLDLTDIHSRTQNLRDHSPLDICAGIGISSPHQAAALAPDLNGLVVGTAFVKTLLRAPCFRDGLAALHDLAAQFAAAVSAVSGSQHRTHVVEPLQDTG